MASIDVLNAKATALLQISKKSLTYVYMYFTMYYPGRGSGNLVQETGIEFGNRLPNQYDNTTPTKLNDDDVSQPLMSHHSPSLLTVVQVFDDAKILVVPISISAIEQTLIEADSYRALYSVFRNSILDSEETTEKKNTLSDPDYSFRFVFYILQPKSTYRDHQLLRLARWCVFSKMHEWRPGAGIEGMKWCIVLPMDENMSEWVTEGGNVAGAFESEVDALLREDSAQRIKPNSVKKLFWRSAPFSSHLWLNSRMARLSPTSSIARLQVCRSTSLLTVQIAKRRTLTSA